MKAEGGKTTHPSSFILHPCRIGLLRCGLGRAKQGTQSTQRFVEAVRALAQENQARLRFFPMQHPADFAILQGAGVKEDEIEGAPWRHPKETLRLISECDLMIAMRLHALIFAGAVQVPCVAVNYDPKVASLARIMGAPLIENASAEALNHLPDAIKQARAMNQKKLRNLQEKARFNAQVAVALGRVA